MTSITGINSSSKIAKVEQEQAKIIATWTQHAQDSKVKKENAEIQQFIEKDLSKSNEIQEQVKLLISSIDNQINSMSNSTTIPKNNIELAQSFGVQSSQLLESLNNATDPKITPQLKEGLEVWLQTGNTLLNTPIETQLSGSNLALISGFIAQGMKFANKLGGNIFDEDLVNKIEKTEESASLLETEPNTKEFYKNELAAHHKNSDFSARAKLSEGNSSESYAAITGQTTLAGGFDGKYTATGADLNMFTILSVVLSCINTMNINSVVVQAGLNTSYSAFIGALQDLQSVITQVSAAFKTAAANAQLINPSNANMNIGFDGSATVASDTDSLKYNIINSMLANQNGEVIPSGIITPNESFNLASLLTMFSITSTTATDKTPVVTSYSSNLNVHQSNSWKDQVVQSSTYGIYIGIGSSTPSDFIKSNSTKYSLIPGTTTRTFTDNTFNFITINVINNVNRTAFGNGAQLQKSPTAVASAIDPNSYFVNQDNIQNMINKLGAQAKAITGTDFSKSNSSWFKGGTQCDGLSSALNVVLSSAQAKASSVVSQIGLINQNNSTLTNSILSAYQSITNALMKI